MVDAVAVLAAYRQMLWSLAKVPGIEMTIRNADEGGYLYARVGYQLTSRWSFGVASHVDDRSKVVVDCHDVVGVAGKRRVKIDNVIGTITNWASELDRKRVDQAAFQARKDVEKREARQAFRDTYDDLIRGANLTTRNKRTMRFERHPLHENARHPEAGTFECQVTDQGTVHLEIEVHGLPVGVEGRASVLPTLLLLHTVLNAISECRAAYATDDQLKAAAAKGVANG